MYRTNLQRVFDPWADLRTFDDFFKTLPEQSSGFPAVCAWKDEEKATVELEIPGMDPADIEISVKGTSLKISGERKGLEIKDEDHFHHRERWYGEFTRAFDLPYEVDSSKVDAAYKEGILTIALPRAEADKPIKIEIALN
jgi:HSP20 family protein